MGHKQSRDRHLIHLTQVCVVGELRGLVTPGLLIANTSQGGKMATSVHILTALVVALLSWEANAQSCGVVDLGFILDSSGSLRADYHREKAFLKEIAAAFGISESGSRAGVVTFSFDAELSIRMNDYFDQIAFDNAVDAIPLMGSITRIDRALRLAQRELFDESNGGRRGVSKILVLLTDGSQTPDADAEDPGNISDEIRASGVTVIVVGIGPGTDPVELDHMAGGAGRSFRAASFDELMEGEFIDKVSKSTCPTIPGPPGRMGPRGRSDGGTVITCGQLEDGKNSCLYPG